MILQMLGNIGDVIQKFPSIDTQVDILIKSTLVCVENSDIPYHLSKSALQVLNEIFCNLCYFKAAYCISI